MNLSRIFASFVLISAISTFVSPAFAAEGPKTDGEKQVVREPAQKKSVPASGESTWGSSSTNGDFVNLRLAALGALIGYLNLDLEFKIAEEWSIGPTLSYWRFNYETTAYVGNKLDSVYKSIGVRANWSQNGAYRTGLYVAPMLQFVSATVEGVSVDTGRNVTGEAKAPVLTGLVGYHWFGDGGWNVNVGAGLSIGTSATKAEATDGTTSVKVESQRSSGLALDFMVGYVF